MSPRFPFNDPFYSLRSHAVNFGNLSHLQVTRKLSNGVNIFVSKAASWMENARAMRSMPNLICGIFNGCRPSQMPWVHTLAIAAYMRSLHVVGRLIAVDFFAQKSCDIPLFPVYFYPRPPFSSGFGVRPIYAFFDILSGFKDFIKKRLCLMSRYLSDQRITVAPKPFVVHRAKTFCPGASSAIMNAAFHFIYPKNKFALEG